MADPDCLFCKIAAGEIPSTRVDEDERTVAFMDINPATRGHLLVIPREHSTDLLEVPRFLRIHRFFAQRSQVHLHERQTLAIRREQRAPVVGSISDQQPRVSAGGRHGPDVAAGDEGDLRPVGRQRRLAEQGGSGGLLRGPHLRPRKRDGGRGEERAQGEGRDPMNQESTSGL